MSYYAKQPSQVDKVNKQVEEVKAQMQKNVTMVMNRGESLDKLEKQTEKMKENSNMFSKNTKKVTKLFEWKNKKWTIIMIVVILILLALLGGFLYYWFGIRK